MTTGLFLAADGDRGFWMPPQASEYATHVDALFQFILWLCIFFFALLMGLTVYWAWKYRKVSDTQRSSPVAHNFKLEFLWSAIPTVLLVVIFAWGFRDFTSLSATPADALELRVVAQKWQWTISYPKMDRECGPDISPGGEANTEFFVPVDRPFTLQMSSNDVLHSFWIPAFRVKRDVLPNRYTGFTVTPTRPGDYPLFCAEYCGDNHSQMRGVVHVLSAEDWADFARAEDIRCRMDPKSPDYPAQLFSRKFGCATCHGIKPEQGVLVGPNLAGIMAPGRKEKTDKGEVVVDADYIKESIEYPENKRVIGFEGKNMPSFRGRITESELHALTDYIKSLK